MSSDVRRRIHQDYGERTTTFEISQDVEPQIDLNRKLRDMEQPSDWGRHIASIPVTVLTQWLNEAYANGNTSLTMASREFDEIIRKKLRDHDWLWLRTDKPTSPYRR